MIHEIGGDYMDFGEFRAAAARANVTNRSMADELGISEQALYNKINGITEFKNSEIKKLASILKLSLDGVNRVFFDGDVN